MKKVFFLIPALGGGGAERVMFYLLQNIDRNKFKPKLILFERKGELLSRLPSDIDIAILKSDENMLWRIWGITWLLLATRLGKLVKNEEPDVVVSFMWYANLMALIARSFSKKNYKAIVSERYGLAVSYEGKLTEFLRRIVIRFFYPKADSIIVNSKEMERQLMQGFDILHKKIAAIYNPIDIWRITELSKEKADSPRHKENIPIIIAAGRLTLQKGFSYLIQAFHNIATADIPCRLVILGEGSERKNLEILIEELGLEKKVELIGFQENPYKYLAHSTLFVLSSLYEGFPNVLLEAMALGVPSVATRCPTGPEEIITDGVNGLLVPPADEKTLAETIKKLLMDEDLRKRLGEAGKKRAEDFRAEKIIKEYEAVIEGVCAGSAVR